MDCDFGALKKGTNTKSSSSTPLLETSVLTSLVQSRRHLYVEESRALVELNTCRSSLKSPQFRSPHSTCLPIFPSPPSSQSPPPGLIPSHWKHWIGTWIEFEIKLEALDRTIV